MRVRIALFFLLGTILNAGRSAEAQPTLSTDERLRVFIDCAVYGCDYEYFRTEIPFVDHVRDRAYASLHILITSQSTAGGGTEYTLNFIGLNSFAAKHDTLRAVAQQSATDDEKRAILANTIKLGIIPFIAHSPVATDLRITYKAAKAANATDTAGKKRDPWNFWVFRTSLNGNFSGEESQHFNYLNASTSANRTTEEWKIVIRANGTYNESKFAFSDGTGFANYSHSYGGSELIVRSAGPHWSFGQKFSLNSSTYYNQKITFRFAPAIEYNLFPYSQSTRRQFTLQYSIGGSYFHYEDTTIFNKIAETHPDHSLIASLDLKQPWGSVSSSLEGATLLDDFAKNRLISFSSLSLRLFKGLNLNFFGSAQLVRDQLYLAAGGLTQEEVLLRRRQLSTSYRYFGGIGLSYTFGSIFNNVVNSRFGGSSGNIVFFD